MNKNGPIMIEPFGGLLEASWRRSWAIWVPLGHLLGYSSVRASWASRLLGFLGLFVCEDFFGFRLLGLLGLFVC